eukprot:16197-Heterococcus_DN1.PRE.1
MSKLHRRWAAHSNCTTAATAQVALLLKWRYFSSALLNDRCYTGRLRLEQSCSIVQILVHNELTSCYSQKALHWRIHSTVRGNVIGSPSAGSACAQCKC